MFLQYLKIETLVTDRTGSRQDVLQYLWGIETIHLFFSSHSSARFYSTYEVKLDEVCPSYKCSKCFYSTYEIETG